MIKIIQIVAVIFIFLVLLLGQFYENIFSFLVTNSDIIRATLENSINYGGWITLVVTLVYYKSDRFYLFVHRHFLRYISNTHSKWQIIAIYDTDYRDNLFRDLASIVKGIYKNISIDRKSDQHWDLMIQDEFKLSIRYGASENHLTLTTSKKNVHSKDYDKELGVITKLLEQFEEKISKRVYNYSLIIEFPQRNPYLGLLLKQYGDSEIKQFNLSLILSPYIYNANIQAHEKDVVINTDSILTLQNAANDIFGYSAKIALR